MLDLIKEPARGLFPVGRLDKDTEGLLLLTNDGALAHELLSPKKHVDKCYYAVLDGPVGEKEQEAFAEGLDIGDEKQTLPAKLVPAGRADAPAHAPSAEGTVRSVQPESVKTACPANPYGVFITIQEGRFHQIKRMAKAVGREVLYLKRISMGSLRLDDRLSPGEYRPLTEEEIAVLKGE